MDEIRSKLLRGLPKIDEVLLLLKKGDTFAKAPKDLVVDACRQIVAAIRKDILAERADTLPPSAEEVAELVRRRVESMQSAKLRRVINATGIILHTNLGRAPLCKEALDRINEVARGYSNLEFDLATGKRGLRYDHVKDLLCGLTGAEDALVVNNNAAAVLLVLNTIADGKEAVVSRGELVEIGGEFRIPEVMKRSGAVLREVGTTNRTRPRDYEEAIGERTAVILKVHTSNFRIVGFTEEVELARLVGLGKERGIPVVNDLGSGCLIDLDRYGVDREPTVKDAVRAGADVVTFSGDKLLGGPQSGIILGRKDLLQKIEKNPLNRALRVDKLTLAALEGTLRQYLSEEDAVTRIRALKTLTEPPEKVEKRARKLLTTLKKTAPEGFTFSLKKGCSMAGGGSLPSQEVATSLIGVRSKKMTANEVEERLRGLAVPIVARISGDEVLLDLRTIDEEEFPLIKEGLMRTASP
ncbi:MAG: L-seryl-tRNA(Sec) selenium transferase [Syntrophobacterales bacterium]|nr:L-seryl-tRNA(Sec) selenium transferase [Syntrophobacterales bacterium]